MTAAATKAERTRCIALTSQLAAHPQLLAKHLAAGSSLLEAKAELADVLTATAKNSAGTKPIRFTAAAPAADTSAADLEARWAANTDNCRANFMKKEHFISWAKRHAAK